MHKQRNSRFQEAQKRVSIEQHHIFCWGLLWVLYILITLRHRACMVESHSPRTPFYTYVSQLRGLHVHVVWTVPHNKKGWSCLTIKRVKPFSFKGSNSQVLTSPPFACACWPQSDPQNVITWLRDYVMRRAVLMYVARSFAIAIHVSAGHYSSLVSA